MARLWIVEMPDSEWKIRRSSPTMEALGIAPKVRDGMITLQGRAFVVNPKKFRRIAYRPLRFLRLSTEYRYVQLWKWDEPEPVDLFASNPHRNDDVSPDVIAQAARSERIRRLVSPGTNWLMILLVLSILGNLMLGMLLYFANTQPAPEVTGGTSQVVGGFLAAIS